MPGVEDREDDEAWSPAYWRDVDCGMQFSGWDFKGQISLDIEGEADTSDGWKALEAADA